MEPLFELMLCYFSTFETTTTPFSCYFQIWGWFGWSFKMVSGLAGAFENQYKVFEGCSISIKKKTIVVFLFVSFQGLI